MSYASMIMGPAADAAEARRAAQQLVSSAVWNSVARTPVTLWAGYREWRRVQGAVTELSDLSDRMLADIGIRRSDIPRLARQGRNATDIRR